MELEVVDVRLLLGPLTHVRLQLWDLVNSIMQCKFTRKTGNLTS
jgi:hypothetical protein